MTGEGRALYELDEPRLAELEVDLIVTQAVCEVCAVSYDDVVAVADRLPSRPDVISLDPSTLAAVLADVERLADAAQVPEAGRELRAGLETRLSAIRGRVAGAPRPTVLALEWLDPPFLGGHWVPEMIEIAGGEALLSEAGEKSREVSWDDLRDLRPDVVVAMPCGYYVEEPRQTGRPQNRSTVAARGLRSNLAVDAASSFSRPGPRLVDGVELLAGLLHPDRADLPSARRAQLVVTSLGLGDCADGFSAAPARPAPRSPQPRRSPVRTSQPPRREPDWARGSPDLRPGSAARAGLPPRLRIGGRRSRSRGCRR